MKNIRDSVKNLIDGDKKNIKEILSAIEEQFCHLAIVVVDKTTDTIIHGSSYVEEQEAIYEDELSRRMRKAN